MSEISLLKITKFNCHNLISI